MHRHAVIATLAAASVVTAAPAQAILISWNNPAGGSSATAANWNPSQVPAEGDILRFNLPNTYSVIFGLAADSVATHQVYDGDVTYDPVIPHGVATGFHVAPNAGQSAIARILNGTMRLGWSSSVGAGGGATGTLRLSGGTTNVGQNVLGAPVSGPVMNVGGTGVAGGTGDLLVLNGAQLDLAYALNVGRFAGSTGTLRVRGAGTGAGGLRRSHVFADSSASDAHVGMDNGHGILEALDGGLFRVGRDLIVAEELGDVGEITIDGENAIDSSEVRVKGDFLVASNGVAGVPGGTATITVDSLGLFIVDHTTVVGDPDGSAAVIRLKPGGRMMTQHLLLEQPGGGSIDMEGGLLQINGGTLSTTTNRLTLPGASAMTQLATIELLNGANASFTGTEALPPLVVGTTGHGLVRVTGGSQLTANGGHLTLGDQDPSTGVLYVIYDGHLSSDRAAKVGVDGYGALLVFAGGQADFDGLDLGVDGGGYGIVEVLGATLATTGPLNVGGTTLAASGIGQVWLESGGILTSSAPLNAGTVWPGGLVTAKPNGRAELTGVMTVRGALAMEGGLVSGGVVALRGAGSIAGSGLVQSGILAAVDSTVTITSTGALEIGRDDAGGDVLMRGTVDVGAHTLTVHDPNSAVMKRVLLSGGELDLPAGGCQLEAGGLWLGHGVIRGPVFNEGRITSDAAAGLQFGGMIYNGIFANIGGDKIVFLSGGGFEGAGGVGAKVQADPGSLIRTTGFVTLGKSGVNDAVILRGRVECGLAGGLTLLSGNQIPIGGELVLDNSGVVVPTGVPCLIEAGGRVTGVGAVRSDVIVDGTVAPGSSAGVLVFDHVTFDAGGTLEAELGAHAANEWDVLQVLGDASLGGTLDLRRLSTFSAAPGDSFQILSCDSVIGTFANVTLDGTPIAGRLDVRYGTKGVWIVVPNLLGVGDDPAPGLTPPVLALQLAPLASPGRNAGIELALPSAATVSMSVFDVHGRQVGALRDGGLSAGRHRFDLERVPGAGVFFVRAVVDDASGRAVKKTRVVRLR